MEIEVEQLCLENGIYISYNSTITPDSADSANSFFFFEGVVFMCQYIQHWVKSIDLSSKITEDGSEYTVHILNKTTGKKAMWTLLNGLLFWKQ